MSLALSGLATVGFHRAVHERDLARFRGTISATEDRVQKRLDTYVAVLLATRGFILATPAFDGASFRHYVSHLDLQKRYPGIQGIGFSVRVTPEERPALEARMTRERGAPFRVWPEGPRPEYHAIVYLEPLDRRNQAAIGYDMFSQPTRHDAMARARDTGAPAASAKVTLVQEIDPNKQAGFLIYVPVYRDGDPGTVEARRRQLGGFVYAPFRVGDLFAGIFGSETEPRIGFEVYDGPAASRGGLMVSAGERPRAERAPRLVSTTRLNVAGRPWTLVFRSTPGFEALSSRRFVPLFGFVGLVASAALFLITRAQVKARERLEELAEDLRRAVRVRDDFLSIAGHELRTPLSALKLQVQGIQRQLQKGAFGPPAPRLVERLAKSSAQVERLERLVGELLDVSRIASGRLTLHPEDVDLAVLLGDVVDRFSDQAQRVGSPLSVRAGAHVVGRWDRVRVDQVLTNLVSNAIKYGAGKPIEICVDAVNGDARVTVKDRGIGVAPEDRDRIFGRFERAVPERHYGGLGLGLWIVRQIVKAHGGRISLESTPGEGSAFTVTLPVHPGEERTS